MGLLSLDSVSVAHDTGSNPVPGALRFIYAMGSSNLCPIYSDTDLTYMQNNPMTADENGVFGLCHLADGSYRVVVQGIRGEILHEENNVVVGSVLSHGIQNEFQTVADLLADDVLSYSDANGRHKVTPGALISVSGESFTYQVLEDISVDAHLISAGGVKYAVLPGPDGFANIRAFGASGVAGQDQDAAIQAAQASALPIHIPGGVFEFLTPLVLSAPWIGNHRSWRGTGDAGITLKFNGVGQAITTSKTLRGITLEANTSVTGQSGVKIPSALFEKFGQIRIEDFDDVSLAIGEKGTSGSYFIDVNGVEIRNDVREGAKACYVAGLSLPNTNAVVFTSIFVTGGFKQYFHIEGNNHAFQNCDANPDNDAVTGGIDYVFNVEGHLNTFSSTYIEPLGATPPDVLFRFGDAANSNRFERTYLASNDYNTDGRTVDLGTNNEVLICSIGFNFPQTVGRKDNLQNLLSNTYFRSLGEDGIPLGWRKTGAGSVARVTSHLLGAPYAMELTATDNAVTLDSHLATTNPNVYKPLIVHRAEKFADRTLTAGVWCWSDQAGLGGIKINAGGATVGTQTHTGSSQWEFLTIQVRAESGAPSISVQLRSDIDNAARTGTCYFSEPVLCLGGEVPKYPEPRPLNDTEAVMAGRVVNNPIITFADGDTTPDVADGNVFKLANTAATTITDFDGQPLGNGAQMITLYATNSNTTLANNGNIRTTANTAKQLNNHGVYQLFWNGTKWIEW